MVGDLGEAPPDRVAVELEQAPRLVVHERHAAVAVGRDRSLADPVQTRLACLQESRDLAGLQTEGLPLEPASEKNRSGHAEREGHQQVEGKLRQHGRELL